MQQAIGEDVAALGVGSELDFVDREKIDIDLDQPIPDLWAPFEALRGIPLLAIRGANSKLLSAATLADMARRHPDCTTLTVEGQGHAPLLETGTLPETIAAFIARVDG